MITSNNSLAPIVLFVYRRPEIVIQSLRAIRRNDLADQSTLYIFADGPKENAGEDILSEIKKTREIIRTKKWTKEVIIVESGKNKGLADSVIGGITEVINKHGKAIVLDDDQYVSKGFLKYMNTALNLFEEEERVMQISGYVFPFTIKVSPKHSAYFIPLPASPSWATWKRAWNKFDPLAKGYEKLLTDTDLSYAFDLEGRYPFTTMMIDQMQNKKVDSWAIRWWWAVFSHHGIALSPDKSLVQYLPSGNKATHVKGNVLPFSHTDFDKNYFINKFPDELVINFSYYEQVKDALLRIVNFSPPLSTDDSFRVSLKRLLRNIFGKI